MRTQLVCGAAFLAACSGGRSYAPPTQNVAVSMAAARDAEESGAAQVPEAAAYLSMARNELDVARRMMKEGKNEQANYVVLRAYADAELAKSLAQQDVAQRRANQAAELARSARRSSVAVTPSTPAEPSLGPSRSTPTP